ncbi:hypothetical protein PFISCL1PPCAC_4429, partial [Pristionchus fissidentatus]
SMTSLSARDSLLLARKCATEVIENLMRNSMTATLHDTLLASLSRLILDAFDSAESGEPFNASSLRRCKELASDFIRDDESNLAKFAYAFSILMCGMKGSIIGLEPGAITELDKVIKTEEPDDEHTAETSIDTNSIDAMIPSDEMKSEVKEEPDEIPLGLVEEPQGMVAVKEEEATVMMNSRSVKNETATSDDAEPDEEATVRRSWVDRTPDTNALIRYQIYGDDEMEDLPKRKKKKYEEKEFDVQGREFCRLCDQTVSNCSMEEHEERCHTEIWLSSAEKCNSKKCDYRSINDAARNYHFKTVHSGFINPNHIRLAAGTPYCAFCPMSITDIHHFIAHMGTHRNMWTTNALVYVCKDCGFKSSRVYKIIRHWRQRNTCKRGLHFDYAAARKAMQAAAAAG